MPGSDRSLTPVLGCVPLECIQLKNSQSIWGKALPRGGIPPVIKRLHFKDTFNDPKSCCQKEKTAGAVTERLQGELSAQTLAQTRMRTQERRFCHLEEPWLSSSWLFMHSGACLPGTGLVGESEEVAAGAEWACRDGGRGPAGEDVLICATWQ
ncbi:hypothetical protein P7K49_035591, partial [Saguinus oedipus]